MLSVLRLASTLLCCAPALLSAGQARPPAMPWENEPLKTVTVSLGGDVIAMKALVQRFPDDVSVVFDSDLAAVVLVFTRSIACPMRTVVPSEVPAVAAGSRTLLRCSGVPGWGGPDGFADPRARRIGPLPWYRWRGLYRHGERTVFSYDVHGRAVLDTWSHQESGGRGVLVRTLNVAAGASAVRLVVAELSGPAPTLPARAVGSSLVVRREGEDASVLALSDAPAEARWSLAEAMVPGYESDKAPAAPSSRSLLLLDLPAGAAAVRLALWRGPAAQAEAAGNAVAASGKAEDLAPLCRGGGPRRWPVDLSTTVAKGADDWTYAVDDIALPAHPAKLPFSPSAIDFFPDGRAAVATVEGDVWLVNGLAGSQVAWRRFASGLYQPLGLRIVDGSIYVTGRDQITRLHDADKDGEAERYECLTNAGVVTANYHVFVFDLESDAAGDLYFQRGSPWDRAIPKGWGPQDGCLLKITRATGELSVVATGLREPNGMCITPDGRIYNSDNQGHWTPSSRLNRVQPGGFYGMVPAAQRRPAPTTYDPPFCWVPHSVDNSSGAPVFASGDRFGPLSNRLLFVSYGKSTLFAVCEDADGKQGGVVRMPLTFPGGITRGRTNPADGQLYLAGLRGWQSNATKPGGLYRIRHTGKPCDLPLALTTHADGFSVRFGCDLAAASATTANVTAKQWNYRWSSNYGSDELLPDGGGKGRATLAIGGVELGADKRTLRIRTAGLKPVMQVELAFALQRSDGTPVKHTLYATLNQVPTP